MLSKATKVLLSPWLALLTFSLLLVVKLQDPFLVESARLKFYDYLMIDKPIESKDIVLANIGEKAIERYGQWPFNREVHSEIINDLYGSGAGVVGSTILFSESDRLGGDKKFSETLSEFPVVLSQTVSTDCAGDPSATQNLRRTGVAVIGDGEPSAFLPSYPCVLAPVQDLQQHAAGVGVTSTLPEPDGVVRRVPLLAQAKGEYYPAFALEVLRVAAGDPSYQAKVNQTGVEALRIPQFDTIKTDEYGRIFINPNYKFREIELGTTTNVDLSEKIVIVGVTAAGIQNPLATPQGAQYPHNVQASILQTLLNGEAIAIPLWASSLDLALFVLLTIGIVVLSRVRYSVVWIMILVGGYFYLPVYLFANEKLLLDITFNIFAGFVIYLHIYTAKFISEYLQKQQIKKQFGTYLSPAMVEKLQKNPELLALGGESRELSIMFTDVRGFTTISEHYGEDVQGLTKIMNRYMTAMTKRIIDNNGTLDKYIGDAQMAFWNAPLDDPDHAKNAVRTALDMLKDLETFNAEIEKEGIPAFGMGLGINTATVVVGNMGSDQRFDYTCLGDGVNLASRLEGQSKPYGVKLVIGPVTAELVRDVYQVIELDLIAVKGKTEPARIFTAFKGFMPAFEADHKSFLEAYRASSWKVAIHIANKLRNSSPMPAYYEMMIERCEEMEKAGVKKFDGVYRATSK